ncbi:Diaminopimelate decarboxylase [hydrothermal vent metagenome]|uniref:diaminopimelate decarboxylase n=1 Tax=hydrothermal vent metagenome TaxID=652676 RepID=A0A1W1CSU0_9ZZZZ
MPYFSYQNNQLCVDSISFKELAHSYQSPLYVYSKSAIVDNYTQFEKSFEQHKHLICYAVKANSNLAILNILANLGSGFDVVSIGELQRVIKAGGQAKKCVFSGVAKTYDEIKQALNLEIKCFNVESIAELDRIILVANDIDKKANVSIRVNPNVDAKTHPYISTGLKNNKFGVDIEDVLGLYLKAKQEKNIKIVGIDCHIGSQITEVSPFLESLDKVLILFEKLKNKGINIEHLDLGGGIGIDYENNQTINIKKYINAILEKTKHLDVEIILEPGRAIVGSAGVFLTKVEYLKQTTEKSFAIVDGAMNDLIRPSLYDAYHNILPLEKNKKGIDDIWDIVGPVCETGDFLGKNRKLSLNQGDYLAVMDAGAYGFTMSSNYNTRPRVAEVMVVKDKSYLIRERESIADLYAKEKIINEK